MMVQPRADPYDPSVFFGDGRVMRAPPAGTVPRSRDLENPVLTSGIENGRPTGRIPVQVTLELLRLGQERYGIFCGVCHGALGDGDSGAARNMPLIQPRSLHHDQVRTAPPGQIYRVIEAGYGLMPSYAAQLGVRERWAVVAYVRALQLSQRARLAALPPEVQAEAQRRLPP